MYINLFWFPFGVPWGCFGTLWGPMGGQWVPHGGLMGSLGPMGPPWLPNGSPGGAHGVPCGCPMGPWRPRGGPNGSPWGQAPCQGVPGGDFLRRAPNEMGGQELSRGFPGFPGFRGFPGNGVRSRCSDPPKHAQESQDDVSSQANSLKLALPGHLGDKVCRLTPVGRRKVWIHRCQHTHIGPVRKSG